MKSGECEMQAFRDTTTKMESLCLPPPPPPPSRITAKLEPLCLPPPPPPPRITRPSFMPPPPPPLSQSLKRHDSPGSGRPMQNRFSKAPDQRQFQHPTHLPFLPPPPPPRFRARIQQRHSSSPTVQYTPSPQCSSLQRRNHDVQQDNAMPIIDLSLEEEHHSFTPEMSKEDIGHTQNETEDKPCTLVETNTSEYKANRKRSADKDSRPDGSFAGLPKELAQKFGPLKCDLCSVSVNSTVQAKMHYSGKQHEKKVHNFLLNWTKETGEPMPKLFKDGPPKKQSTPEVSYCEVCNVYLTSDAHAEQHYMGRNHRRALSGHSVTTTKVEQCVVAADDPTERFGIGTQFQSWSNTDPLGLKSLEADSPPIKSKKFFCELCKVTATSKDQLDMHLRGAKHRKAETASKMKPTVTTAASQATQSNSILASVIQNEEATQNVRKDYSIYRTPSGYYYCQPCNLTLNSEAQFIQHCESKKHKFKTATAKKPNSKPAKAGIVVT